MLLETLFEALGKSIKYIELITAIVGSIYYYKYKNTFLKYFLILLWYIPINGFIARYLHESEILRNNTILYNIYHVINFSFLFFLFKSHVKDIKYKKWINTFLGIYILSFIIDAFYKDYITEIQIIPFIIGGAFVIITILFYFIEILNTNTILYISKNSLFWISIGLLLYFGGKIPSRIIRSNWEMFPEADYSMIFSIELTLSIVMNICFIIGFIYSQKVDDL